MIVPDLLRDELKLVFCGTAPSRVSKEVRAYYAHPGNLFWKTLFDVGLTPRRLAPAEYPLLLEFGIGLTDLNKTEWGADSELTPQGFDVPAFLAKMRRYRPGVIAFTSKTAAGTFTGRKTMPYGMQAETLDGIPLFALPSPSGRARGYFDVAPWQALADRVLADRAG